MPDKRRQETVVNQDFQEVMLGLSPYLKWGLSNALSSFRYVYAIFLSWSVTNQLCFWCTKLLQSVSLDFEVSKAKLICYELKLILKIIFVKTLLYLNVEKSSISNHCWQLSSCRQKLLCWIRACDKASSDKWKLLW